MRFYSLTVEVIYVLLQYWVTLIHDKIYRELLYYFWKFQLLPSCDFQFSILSKRQYVLLDVKVNSFVFQ